MSDAWPRFKVVNVVSIVVDNIPDEFFVDVPPSSPPTEFSAKDSSDSLPTEISEGPSDKYPGSNVTKELLYTERKYVQDLETMQVRLWQYYPCNQFSHVIMTVVFECSCAKQHHGYGHHSATVPEPQQTPQLPTSVPNQAREYQRASLAAASMGKCVHRIREYLLPPTVLQAHD